MGKAVHVERLRIPDVVTVEPDARSGFSDLDMDGVPDELTGHDASADPHADFHFWSIEGRGYGLP